MKKSDVAALLNWFDSNKKDYPWNIDKSPYLVWISEIMLQQTVAASVVPYFEIWCHDYPDIKILASAELNKVLSHWEGLGYYSRCRNLHKAANILIETGSENLPDNYKDLLALPGIGDYTARAILSIAYKKPYAVLDANVRRILQRLSARVDWDTKMDKKAVYTLEEVIPHDRPGDFNEAMMQLGQLVCSSSSPKCSQCPLAGNCLALKKGIAEEIPVKQKKKIRTSKKAALIFYSDEKVLLCRKKRGLFHDLWLTPTVEIDGSQSLIWNGVNLQNEKSDKLKNYNHFYTDNKDILTPYLIHLTRGDSAKILPADDDDFIYRWIHHEKLNEYPSPSVYRKIINEAGSLIKGL